MLQPLKCFETLGYSAFVCFISYYWEIGVENFDLCFYS